ncbi:MULTISPECIES: hypothetical protein [unclassified Streptomyces]|uniref:hypothetical protein n=1 Tax=unclassified Streptomyces TaxID=2593676 RepID=UPI00234AA01D|nr:hypothetical protein [Streptomyces sp. M92]WCN02053.1 hypothetical protein M6G08_08245 [Streptomyces sp. M92]
MRQHTVIPGVVDGTVTSCVDADGHVSLRITIRDSGLRPEEADHIEVVLTQQDARALLPAPERSAPVACSVGVRLNSAPFSALSSL